MTFSRTWSEELVAEYLELKDYFVKIGHPVQIGKRGGRKEIDVLGIKSEASGLKILQVEIGQLAMRKEEKLARIKEKFFDKNVEEEKKKIAGRLGFTKFTPECWYITIWPIRFTERMKAWKELRRDLEPIKVLPFSDFLDLVLSGIQEWKRDNKTPKGYSPTLPEKLWILKMLEQMREAGRIMERQGIKKSP